MTDFNPLNNFNQGLQVANRQREVFNALDNDRKKAFFQDAQKGMRLLEAGDVEGYMSLSANRRNSLNRLNGDTSDIDSVDQLVNANDIAGAIAQLKTAETIGVNQGFLKNPIDQQIKEAKLASLTNPVNVARVQSSKILDDGTAIQVMQGGGMRVVSSTGDLLTGDEARVAVQNSRDQAHNRKKELARLSQTIKREEAKEGLMTAQQRGIQQGNIRRLGALSNTSTGRASSVKKATKFMLALQSGEAFSGAGRKAASFVPGVFSSQGKFDEEFNAFSEVAARQQLKASGETRPTDADVQGMKQAMFGVGRDEDVNVQLLKDFINDQNSQTNELDQLIDASQTGNLGGFTFTKAIAPTVTPALDQDEPTAGQSFNFDAQGNLIQ